ncbi:MAG TPA: hypothetical protein VFB43_18155 [Terracidiphilus sp.]|nr:hypothetical protein [Terracidiphilus sp.]
MGREARCLCERNGVAAPAQAILESRELLIRGGTKGRIPFAEMTQVKAKGDRLSFKFKNEPWSLTLSSEVAAKWAAIILAPPPSLAKKMGITAEVIVEVVGEVDDDALQDALSQVKSITKRNGELIIARVDTPEELTRALKSKAEALANSVPMWVVYRKGRGHALSESDVRSMCLVAGLVDSKVTAVSAALTALRFVKRRAAAKGRA